MSEKVFTSKTLEDCIELASSKLNIPKEKLEYKIIDKKMGLFKKKVSISVNIDDKSSEIKNGTIEIKNGTIEVKNGNIIVKNPQKGGRPATIRPCHNAKIIIDGKAINSITEVYKNTKIDMVFDENTPQRKMNISISPDNMKAYISIMCIPENVYTIKDQEQVESLNVEVKVKNQVYPSPYTIDEIKQGLSQAGIKCGIIEENLKKLTNLEDVNNLLIAKGKEPVDGIDDIIHLNFKTDKDLKKFKEDEEGNVDYKSIGHVNAVKKGSVLAQREEGQDGEDGVDVKGLIKKHKPRKKQELKAGEGCEYKDKDTIISSIDGKPSYKGGIISVRLLHKVNKDVDIKTGNIDFIGDVEIYGSVKEGMKVSAGGNLVVNKNVEMAEIFSKGDMDIYGNIINSTVNCGGEDVNKLNKLKNLQKLSSSLKEIINTVEHIKKFNLLGKNIRDGEIIKVLIENKFKYIVKISRELIKLICIDGNEEERELISCIGRKLIGFAPLNISNVSELNVLIKQIDKVIQIINGTLALPVDMKISYCQDSIINSSGNIVVTGKGEYVSKITAHENIEFILPGSLARGGTIKAKNEIRCRIVGSEGGVSTQLIVESKGNIWVDIAYQNTCFVIGDKEYILELPSKDIHAYLDSDGELIVDKFVL